MLKTKGERLYYLRKLADCTLKEFAEHCECSISMLGRWERGVIDISDKNINRIVKNMLSLNICCSSRWLSEGNGEAPWIFNNDDISKKETKNQKVSIKKTISYLASTFETALIQSSFPQMIHCTINEDSLYSWLKWGDTCFGLPIEEPITEFSGYYIVEHFQNTEIMTLHKLGDKIIGINGNNKAIVINEMCKIAPLKIIIKGVVTETDSLQYN